MRLLAAVLLLAAAACQPTGATRCDRQVGALIVAEREGWSFDCRPPSSWDQHLGWADHDTRTLWIWEHRLTNDRALAKVMWHELGHTVWSRQGRVGSQAQEEAWADGWAWCAYPLPGVSYLAHPTNCGGYLR